MSKSNDEPCYKAKDNCMLLHLEVKTTVLSALAEDNLKRSPVKYICLYLHHMAFFV